jgi:hypothetical protein
MIMVWNLIQKRIAGTSLLFLLLSMAFFFGSPPVSAQSDFHKESVFKDGEWLRYKVKWSFIRLGTLEIFQKRLQEIPGTVYQVKMHARSAKLPFINVFFINEGLLNPYQPTLQDFKLTSGKDYQRVSTYIYNRDRNMILLETHDHGRLVRKDSLFYESDTYDALGIFMMMRCLSNSGFNITLKNIVEYKLCDTRLNFTGEPATIEIDALKKPVAALRFEGKAEWVGESWGGVSGPFHGWISADHAAIPLKVKIKIFLGSITLELEDYTRDGWPVDLNRDTLTQKF